MKNFKRFTTLFTAGIFASSAAYADFGQCVYGNETIPNVVCFGSATLNGTTVTGSVLVTGPLQSSNANMGSLYVAGTATLNNSHVNGDTNIAGPLITTNTKLNGNLFVAANQTTLNSTTVNGSTMIKSSLQSPTLNLNSNSQINNSLTFQGLPGLVVEQGGSSVNGKIINGKVKN